MKHFRRLLVFPAQALSVLAVAALCATTPALAQTPKPWAIGMQTSHSPVESGIQSLHTLVNLLMIAVVILVAALLGYVVWAFDKKRHPVASRTSHNTVLEVAWTVIPVLILVVIAIPSFRLVYFEDRTRDADLTIKVTGHQWYWEYGYPDSQNIHFDSYMIADEDIKAGQIRRLSVDNPLVVPAGKNIRILTTGADVIHSFFIPSLGVQRYAIPGRTIETWMKVDKPGDYYGECNQICGTNHSAMPIHVHAVTDADYKTWLDQAKTKFASDAGPGSTNYAALAVK
ncbi:cytochrome c oxidase subunit II [Acidisphaera sp. L21]|uniref:cytochrome c oxidase subunit II n=1 Tax=Acidisphaera sp. L21 TaxID=1641851 RepID=UPI00131B4483|nr:cytochrome c oxidase subunit II [Acidisphaera sp. L21]